jgi:ASC-1-like (ASCH) protein
MKTLNLIFREQDKDSFNRIKNGEKLYETRAGLPEYLGISAGDELIITCGTDTITKTVKEALHFKTQEELLEKISVEDIMPAGTTNEELIARWNSFPNYPERIKQYGIIAWKL